MRLLLSLLFLTGCASVSLNDFGYVTTKDVAEIIVRNAEEDCITQMNRSIETGYFTQEKVDLALANGAMAICIEDMGNFHLSNVKKEWTNIDGRWYSNNDLQKLDDQIDWGELFFEGVAFALEQEANYQQRVRDTELRNLRAQVKALSKQRQMRDLGLIQ